MNLWAVALVKQDRENDLFHIFDLDDALNAQRNASSESWTFTLGNCVATPKWKWRFPQSRKLLLVHHFDLLADYLACKPIDGDVSPVTLLALHDEVCKVGFRRRISATLCNHVDHQVPGSCL